MLQNGRQRWSSWIFFDARFNQPEQVYAFTLDSFYCMYRFPFYGPVFRQGDPRTAFVHACQRAKIEDFHFHDLRHCFVTRSRREGYQDRRIMSITGHKTMSVFTRYDTVDREAEETELREIVRKASCSKLVAVNSEQERELPQPVDFSGGPSRTRTGNPLIKSGSQSIWQITSETSNLA